MWIVAVGWIYVVALMAATEPSLFAGIMTFFGYCVLPLSLVFYLTGSKRRRARRAAAVASADNRDAGPGD
jgi:FtsH-binding integral membrane protein